MRKHPFWLTIILGLVMLVITLRSPPALADFFNSPTNYVPPVSAVYVCNMDSGTIAVLDGVTGATLRTIALPAGARPSGIAFRPNYNAAYVTDIAQGRVYYIADNQVMNTITTASTGNTSIALHPGGNFAYISASAGVLVLDTNPNRATFQTVIKTLPVGFYPGSIVFTPDGTRAYVSVDGNYGSISQIKVITTRTHAVSNTIQLPVPTAPLGIAATADGSRVYVAGWVAHTVSVIDSNPASPTYNKVIKAIAVSGEARGIALSPTGNLAYVTLDTGGVDVIVTAPSSSQFHQVIAHVPAGPFGGIHSVAASLDGRFTYVTVADAGQNTLYRVDSEPFSATFNSVIGTVRVGDSPAGMAVKPR